MFLLYLEVEQSDIGKLLSDLAPYIPNMRDFRMEVESKTPVAKPKRAAKTPGRSRVQEIILNTIADGKPHSYFNLQLALTEGGFAANSLSPAISYLMRDGKIVKTSSDHIQLSLTSE